MRRERGREREYVEGVLREIRRELRGDMARKRNAVVKMGYLWMHGYAPVSLFEVTEVVSEWKREGYAAAGRLFCAETPEGILLVNVMKKDLSSAPQTIAAVLDNLPLFLSPQLALALLPDLTALASHSSPAVRARCLVSLHAIALRQPLSLPQSYPKLKQSLADTHPSVVLTSINIFTNLIHQNPSKHIHLTPTLFAILSSSSNNWILIKLLKIFSLFTQIEPRIIPKLIHPFINIINTSSATSLVYEAIQSLINGHMICPEDHPQDNAIHSTLTNICINKLKSFIVDSDPNLKYLGLISLNNLLKLRPSASNSVADNIFKCLADPDYSIRLRAIALISSISTKNNIFAITKHLIRLLIPKNHKNTPLGSLEYSYRSSIAKQILSICSKNNYSIITNFEWLLSLLIDLSFCPGINIGSLIAHHLIQLVIRVNHIVPFAVSSLYPLITDSSLYPSSTSRVNNSNVLYAVAWIIGEYCRYLTDPFVTIEKLLDSNMESLNPGIQVVYLQSILKIYSYWISDETSGDIPPEVSKEPSQEPPTENSSSQLPQKHSPPSHDDFIRITHRIITRLTFFTTSPHLHVQDTASFILYTLKLILIEHESSSTMTHTDINVYGVDTDPVHMVSVIPKLFMGEFNPVVKDAMERVCVPDTIDLDTWIIDALPEPPRISSLDLFMKNHGNDHEFESNDGVEENMGKKIEKGNVDKSNPFYLVDKNKDTMFTDDIVNKIPVIHLTSSSVSVSLKNSVSSPNSVTGGSMDGDDTNDLYLPVFARPGLVARIPSRHGSGTKGLVKEEDDVPMEYAVHRVPSVINTSVGDEIRDEVDGDMAYMVLGSGTVTESINPPNPEKKKKKKKKDTETSEMGDQKKKKKKKKKTENTDDV